MAVESDEESWGEHPNAPANKKRPDSGWVPKRQRAVSDYWDGELDVDNLDTIIPLED